MSTRFNKEEALYALHPSGFLIMRAKERFDLKQPSFDLKIKLIKFNQIIVA